MPKIPQRRLKPFWSTSDGETVRLFHGDVIDVLRRMPSSSVQMVVTSPPYWNLRDYGCDKSLEIGSEKTPDEYVEKMARVFREVYRVLRDDGTVWLNLGDSYTGVGKKDKQINSPKQMTHRGSQTQHGTNIEGLRPGNLIGIPWRVALALQADGWILRQDIIWHKPSPMPESVRNRCTKAHEYLFLLAKKKGYYCDMEAIKEISVDKKSHVGRGACNAEVFAQVGGDKAKCHVGLSERGVGQVYPTRNKRSVWTVASEPYSGAHFSTFPKKLITPCILAGTSEHGCCTICGAPWKRVVERKKLTRKRPNEYTKRTGEPGTGNSCANTVAGVEVKTVGWEASCDCNTDKVVPCTVADIFVGSGTTCCVALAHGRRSWGIDLSKQYLENNAIPRIEGELLSLFGGKRNRGCE